MSRHQSRAGAGDNDLYATLEVPRDAGADDIRRAYKKLALKWHPDKNPSHREAAEAKFKAISRAYEVLGNDQTRRQYDRYGLEGIDAGSPTQPEFSSSFGGGGAPRAASGRSGASHFSFHDPFDVFRQFFGGSDPFFGGGDDGFDSDPFFTGGLFGGLSRARHGGGFMAGFPTDMLAGFSTVGGGGFGGARVSISTSSTSFSGNGASASTSSTTEIRNGKKITRTVRQTRDIGGTVHEDVDERIEDLHSHGTRAVPAPARLESDRRRVPAPQTHDSWQQRPFASGEYGQSLRMNAHDRIQREHHPRAQAGTVHQSYYY